MSRQHDASTWLLFFGDRVAPTDFAVSSQTGFTDAAGVALTDRVAMRLGIVVLR